MLIGDEYRCYKSSGAIAGRAIGALGGNVNCKRTYR